MRLRLQQKLREGAIGLEQAWPLYSMWGVNWNCTKKGIELSEFEMNERPELGRGLERRRGNALGDLAVHALR